MLNAAGFFGKARADYWEECASTAAKLDDLLSYSRGVPAKLFEGIPSYKKYLHPFGELAVFTKGAIRKTQGKLINRGDIYFFAGYAEDHAGEVFRMVKISTGRVSETRDVTFLGIMYGEIVDSDNFFAV